jgi:long-chain acyl-CoA synthetase
MNALLGNAMRQFAAKPAFHAFGTTLTYEDVDRLSYAFAAFLQQTAGVKAGDRVAVMLPNLLAFPIATIAIWRIGGIVVNVNPLYTARELEHQLNDAGVESIVVCTASAAKTLAAVIDTTQVKTVVTVSQGDCGGIGPIPSDQDRAILRDAVSLSTAIARGESFQCDPVHVSSNDLLLLQYTGGTTGVSKGAALSHRNVLANIEQFKAFMSGALDPGSEVVVTAIPLYHIFALAVNFLTYFSIGAENWLVANPRNAEQLFDVLEAARPTVLTGVNTLYAALASHPRMSTMDWSRLKLSAGGGDERRLGALARGHRQVHPRGIRFIGDLAGHFVQSSVHCRIHGDDGDARALHGRETARRRRQRSGYRRMRRGVRERPAGNGGVLERAGSERHGVHAGRLFPNGRYRCIR